MSSRSALGDRSDADRSEHLPFQLSDQQKAYFETFGFLLLPGLFADDIAAMTTAFEETFEQHPAWESHEQLHFNDKRLIIPDFTSQHPTLHALLDDPRVVGTVTSLIGPEFETLASDASLFYCDTSWHPDTYGSPIDRYHVKLSFYLDPLSGSNGAIRMIPGTNHHRSPYATQLRDELSDHASIEQRFGVQPHEIPSWTLESQPGDVVAWNYRTIHASFNGGQRRRLFSLNFAEPTAG